MKSIITNTSPITGLSMLGQLPLLWELFDQVYVPQAVISELTNSLHENDYGRKEIIDRILDTLRKSFNILYRMNHFACTNVLYEAKLHEGRTRTASNLSGGNPRSLFTNIDFVLRSMKKQLENHDNKIFFLTPIGILGILRIAKSQEKIEEIKPYLDTLITNEYRIEQIFI